MLTKKKSGNKTLTRNANIAQQTSDGDAIDVKFGFNRILETEKLGWLLNYLPITTFDGNGNEISGLDLYFIDRNGDNFKASICFEPYFLIDVSDSSRLLELSQHLQKRFPSCVIHVIDKEDLDLPNHLSGKTHAFLKLSFKKVSDLVDSKSILRPIITQNQKSQSSSNYSNQDDDYVSKLSSADPLSFILDMREYDVPYTMRAAIDMDLRVGSWYIVITDATSSFCEVRLQKDMLELCEPRIVAFDIECEKSPLKFPNADRDRIFMISYMTAGQGFLLINREIVSEDISDFEYTPSPKYPGPFTVFNIDNEENLLKKFLDHIQELRPHVIVTYNGDFFDWPYVESRCGKYENLSIYNSLGITSSKTTDTSGKEKKEYTGRCLVHLDAFCWVQRDSYLPQGNQGLKAVTKYKLGYDPVEVDPEDMIRFAIEKPDYMASYSVSDAVATYYLYTTYVHNFIFSLSTIIPLASEDVLRKGSGTLCEALLMVEAYRGNIICPNKQVDPVESFANGHLLESETYIGGHVECLEAGVFRSDIPVKFQLVSSALSHLINRIDRDLTFAIEVENGIQRSDILNYDEIKQEIIEKLELLRDDPNREEVPVIYHLDVGAMYPNIILTNRLQPSAMVTHKDCAACDFNRVENKCKRDMQWTWRGDYSPASQAEYTSIRRQLSYERVEGDKMFSEINDKEQAKLVKDRLKKYSHRVYKKTKVESIELKTHTVCQRENAFYVNTVRAFRDRRYDYKLLTKVWKGKKVDAEKKGDALARKLAEDKEVLMDSLQLAHKCILNSFYGYVMRKGARWRSMEMAGIVTHTGAQIIKQARELVEQVGRPLELDTDGIWCVLPASFPQDFKLKVKSSGKMVSVGYPCAMLNADVHDRFTNHQYQDILDTNAPIKQYGDHSECSIFFELDGPYHSMVLPASPEEGKLLKKKYVVFNFDGSLAELKGFEVKRRGELELVKLFQSQVFDKFLAGNSLEDCYHAVGTVANQWLDVLDNQGVNMDSDELLELISERKTISKTLEDYEGRKATSLTTASRLADFLGSEMVKDKGLNCKLIISKYPTGAPTTERAIPVAIFSVPDANTQQYWLKKWLKNPIIDFQNADGTVDFRDVVDWDYYKDRLGKSIQKIITIPAGMQRVQNPVPRVEHPSWLQKRLADIQQGLKQRSITSFLQPSIQAQAFPKIISGTAVIPVSGSQRAALCPTSVKLTEDDEIRKRSLSSTFIGDDISKSDISFSASTPIKHSQSANDDEDTPPLVHNVTSDSHGIDIMVSDSVNNLAGDLSPEADVQEWLKSRQSFWKTNRRAKKSFLKSSLLSSTRKYGQRVSESLNGNMQALDTVAMKKKSIGLTDYVRNAALITTYGYWQILELQQIDHSPGEFIAWAMTNQTQLQRLHVIIPRTLYVNCYSGELSKSFKSAKDAENAVLSLGGVRVVRDLPYSKPCYNLYEIKISEEKYHRNEKALDLLLCDSGIEGVYEREVPLIFRGILQAGCVAQLSRDKEYGTLTGQKNYKLQDLNFINVKSHPYLEPSVATFKQIFVYMALDKSRNSGLGAIGLFIIDSNSRNDNNGSFNEQISGKAFIWLVSPTSSTLLDSKPPFQRLYRQYVQITTQIDPTSVGSSKDSSLNVNDVPNTGTVKFSTNYVQSISEAFKLCSDRLAQYSREKHGPTVVVSQGATDSRTWRRLIPALLEFPMAVMPSNTLDELYPAIGWQMFIAERMIQRFIMFPRWFSDRLNCARAAHIPVCNLGNDAITVMTDVLFARVLQQGRHLLWATENKLPDTGDDNNHELWAEQLEDVSISTAGAYRSVCIELDVYGMAICSIMNSALLDAQGLVSSATGSTSSLSGDSSCSKAFNLLKAVISKWLDDSRTRGDKISDSLLVSFYRYLCGYGDTLLYDPRIYRVVNNLMRKLFKKLISELTQLGVKIVFADFNRMIVNTNKKDIVAAKEYIEFILLAIHNNDCFGLLEITPTKFWEQLLWMSIDNWGGIMILPDATNSAQVAENFTLLDINKSTADEEQIIMTQANDCSSTNKVKYDDTRDNDLDEYGFLDEINSPRYKPEKYDDIDENYNDDDDNESDELAAHDQVDANAMERGSTQSRQLESHWTMANTLPTVAQNFFKFIIGEFLNLYQTKKYELSLQRDEQMTDLNNSYDSLYFDSVILTDAAIATKLDEYMRYLISSTFTTKLLSLVDEISNIYVHDSVSDSNSGMRSNCSRIALDFVKLVTSVLALDLTLSEDVSALRRVLLTQLHVREFSPLAQFSNPIPSYILRDVICKYCSTCRDLDLLKDSSLQQENESKDSKWNCLHCGNVLDIIEIENRLIDDVERLSSSYLVQDFRCPKTHQVSSRLCTGTSELAAPLVMDLNQEDISSQLQSIKRVAKCSDFSFLLSFLRELQI